MCKGALFKVQIIEKIEECGKLIREQIFLSLKQEKQYKPIRLKVWEQLIHMGWMTKLEMAIDKAKLN